MFSHFGRFAVFVACLSACAVLAQQDAGERVGRVYRDRVEPHWFANGARFWYRVETGKNQREFVLVDVEKGTRQVVSEDVATNSPGATSAARSEIPRASTRTGPETLLTFINHTTNEVQLFWLDPQGDRQSYGKLAAGATHEQHTYAGHVWVVANSDGRMLAVFEAQETVQNAEINANTPAPRNSPFRSRRQNPSNQTSPDGKWRILEKDYNLVVRHTESGKETVLTTNGTAADAYSDRVQWSPDSRRLVALRTQPAQEHKVYVVESSPKDQAQPKLQSYDYLKPGDRIAISKPHLFDVENKREIPVEDALFSNPWSINEIRWAKDSSHFTFLYNQRGHQALRIVSVDAANGAAKAIVNDESKTFIDYSGKKFSEYLDDTSEIIWMSERDGWNHLYLYEANTGAVKNQITKGHWVVRNVERVDKEKRQIWFRAGGIRPGQDPYYVHFARVNFDGSGLVVLTEGDGAHSVQWSPDRRCLIDTWSRVDSPPVTELRRSENGGLVCKLETGDASELTASGWKPPERFVAKGRDGESDIYGILHWPKNFDPQRKYPVIESIYAGPQDSFVPKSFATSYSQRRLTNRGFVVAQIDGMGTSNRSKKFHDVCWKNLGDAGLPDRILWLKAAAQKYPALDLERAGIYGTSAGGQSALRAMLAHGDFYRAAVADSGCHDNRMDKIWWNEQWMGWPVGPHYAEQSNVTQAQRLQGKLLLMAGELDKNVDPASTMQVVNALIKANKDFELLIVPGAGHGILGSAYGQQRLVDFFTRAFYSGG